MLGCDWFGVGFVVWFGRVRFFPQMGFGLVLGCGLLL